MHPYCEGCLKEADPAELDADGYCQECVEADDDSELESQ